MLDLSKFTILEVCPLCLNWQRQTVHLGKKQTGAGNFEFHSVCMLVLLKICSSPGESDVPVGKC